MDVRSDYPDVAAVVGEQVVIGERPSQRIEPGFIEWQPGARVAAEDAAGVHHESGHCALTNDVSSKRRIPDFIVNHHVAVNTHN